MIDGKLVFCPECGTIDLCAGVDVGKGVYFLGCHDCDVWIESPIDRNSIDNLIMFDMDIEDNLNSLRRQWTAND